LLGAGLGLLAGRGLMRGALVAQGLLGLCQRGIGLIERGARGVLLLAQAGQHALRGQTGVDFGLVGLAQGSEGRPARLGEGIGEIGPCGAGAGFVLARFALRVQGGASPGKGLVGGAGLAQGLVEIGGLPGLGGDVGGQGIVAVLKGAGLVARGDEIVAEQGLQGIGGMLPRAADRAGLAIVERRAHDLRGLIGGLRGAFMARAGGVEGGGKGGAFGLVGGDLRGEGLALGLARGEHSGVAGKGLRALVGLLPGGPGGGIGQHGGGEGLGAGGEGGEVFGAEVSGVGGLCLCQRGPGRGVPVFGLAPGLLRGVAGLLRGFDRLRQRAEAGVLFADPGPGGVVAGQEGRDLAFALGQRAQGGPGVLPGLDRVQVRGGLVVAGLAGGEGLRALAGGLGAVAAAGVEGFGLPGGLRDLLFEQAGLVDPGFERLGVEGLGVVVRAGLVVAGFAGRGAAFGFGKGMGGGLPGVCGAGLRFRLLAAAVVERFEGERLPVAGERGAPGRAPAMAACASVQASCARRAAWARRSRVASRACRSSRALRPVWQAW
jgi:hypothetical protein